MDTGTLNFLAARALIDGLAAAGVTEAVISPGSRSTPLTLALLREPRIRCTITVDERSAAFFALGLGKARRHPALLVATSGTAPANWLPAVIEACQADVPLLLLSADRPPEIRGWGANQTVDQTGLFAAFVRAHHDLPAPSLQPGQAFSPESAWRLAARVVEESRWPQPGPVHLNLPFHEPLIPGDDIPPLATAPALHIAPPQTLPDAAGIDALAERISGRPGLIVCGELPAGDACRKNALFSALTVLSARLASPLLLEPLSGLRYGPHWASLSDGALPCTRYAQWSPEALAGERPEWLLRIGPWPVTRALQSLAASAAWQALIDPTPAWHDPLQRLDLLLRADPLAACTALLARPLAPAPAAWRARLAALESRPPTSSPAARRIAAVLAALPEATPLLVGNSLAIRELDHHGGWQHKTIDLFGNRGASGIDGQVSTAAGIAAARGRCLALLGDLTTQHDLGGLALARGRSLVVVTVNNGGGGIFDQLPQAALPEFIAGWRTPQTIDFAAAAATFGIAYRHAGDPETLQAAIAAAFADGGPHLIETVG